MSESKTSDNKTLQQCGISIIGILLFAIGGVLLIYPAETIAFWAVQGYEFWLIPYLDSYFPTLLGTMAAFFVIGLGLVLILWGRPR